MARGRTRRAGWDWPWIDPEWEADPDDMWQAQAALPVGEARFTEYDEPDAAVKPPHPRKADRVRFGFQSPGQAYDD